MSTGKEKVMDPRDILRENEPKGGGGITWVDKKGGEA